MKKADYFYRAAAIFFSAGAVFLCWSWTHYFSRKNNFDSFFPALLLNLSDFLVSGAGLLTMIVIAAACFALPRWIPALNAEK